MKRINTHAESTFNFAQRVQKQGPVFQPYPENIRLPEAKTLTKSAQLTLRKQAAQQVSVEPVKI